MDRSTRGLPSPLPNASSSLSLGYRIIDPFIDTERVMRERYRISAKSIVQLSLERERNHQQNDTAEVSAGSVPQFDYLLYLLEAVKLSEC